MSRARIVCLVSLWSLLCAGGGGIEVAAANTATGASEELGAGHRRMLQRLEEIATESLERSPFVGRWPIADLRVELEAIPEGAPDLKRWMIHKLLGKHELRLGNEQRAIENYETAYRLLDVFGDKIPREEAITAVYDLGVAHLRRAETRNCVERRSADSCIFPIRSGGVFVEKDGSRKAVRYFTEVLKSTPPRVRLHVKAKWLLNIAYMTLGEYPADVPEAYRIDPVVFAADEAFPRFTDIAPRLGLDSFDLAGGAVAEDFDGNGFLDIMVSTSNPAGQLRYYRNNGDGTFTERTDPAGLTGLVGGLNLIHADYDNDGNTDVLVLRGAWNRERGRQPNSLIRNLGDGTFRDVTFESGLGEVHYPTQTAAWADYDHDGNLDLYIGNEASPEVPAPCQLFRNKGDGTFEDVASTAGVQNNRFSKAVVWGDYDGDRFPDLYVSNMGHPNRLYHNNGDGTFTDVAPALGVSRPLSSFPAWFWDFDNDGALDLFVAGYGGVGRPTDLADVAAGYLGLPPGVELDHLYRGDGRGGFANVAEQQGLTLVTLPMGSNFGDLDNDGYPDFYLGTGYPFYEGVMPNVMYRNRGGTGFADITTSGGFGQLHKGHGVAFADLDNDGDQDVFEQLGGAFPGDAYGNALLENPGMGHRWIKLELVGTRSNRSGIGARIRVDIVEDGKRRSIYKHVNSGGSFGANPLRQEIGLGRAEKIETVEVYWPTSDLTQGFRDVALDQLIEATEGRDTYKQLPLERIFFD